VIETFNPMDDFVESAPTGPALFYYDVETMGYHNIESPTPYIDEYYTYNPTTESFESYNGQLSFSGSSYFEPSPINVYTFDEESNSYVNLEGEELTGES
jgi:hypothetical protein